MLQIHTVKCLPELHNGQLKATPVTIQKWSGSAAGIAGNMSANRWLPLELPSEIDLASGNWPCLRKLMQSAVGNTSASHLFRLQGRKSSLKLLLKQVTETDVFPKAIAASLSPLEMPLKIASETNQKCRRTFKRPRFWRSAYFVVRNAPVTPEHRALLGWKLRWNSANNGSRNSANDSESRRKTC